MKTEAISFIIRIWMESVSDDDQKPVWRGVIEQVGNAEKRYFQDLETIAQFIREKSEINQPQSVVDKWLALQRNLGNEIRKWLPHKH